MFFKKDKPKEPVSQGTPAKYWEKGSMPSPGTAAIVNMSQLPQYVEERLNQLKKSYCDIINLIANGSDAVIKDAATQSGLRILNHRINVIGRPELSYLLKDQTKNGVVKALTYLSDEASECLDTYKRTGNLPDGKVWK